MNYLSVLQPLDKAVKTEIANRNIFVTDLSF